MFSELKRHRELLIAITTKEIRIRYKQSVMGFFWALLMPILIVSAGVVVKNAFSVVSGKHLETSELVSVLVKSVVLVPESLMLPAT